MTSTASTTPPKRDLMKTVETNALGEIAGLEPHTTYFVIRKPTPELTKEKSKEFVEDVRAFLHEQRVLAEKQLQELNHKYGEPAKARVQDIRSTLEKRFDEIAKEVESRVQKVEHDLQERGILRNKAGAAPGPETPGEMPK